MLLDGVVGQVDEWVVRLVEVVLLSAHANVALLEVVALVLVRYQNPQPNVELSLANQERPLNVLLDDEDVRFDTADRLHLDLLVLLVRARGSTTASHGLTVSVHGRQRVRWIHLESVLGEMLKLLRFSTRCQL